MNVIIGFDYAALDAETRIVVEQRARELKEDYRQFQAHIRNTVETAWRMGEKLLDVQKRLKDDGRFLTWIDAEFPFKRRNAYRFMNLATHFEFANLANVEIGLSAAYLLTEPSTPEEARSEALELAASGQTITHAAAKQIVAAHKPTNSHRSGVNFSGEGAEPDLDETGQPLTRRYEDDEDEELRPGDVVQYGGKRFTLRSVASSGRVYFDLPKSHKLYGRGIESEDVLLIERAADRRVQSSPAAATAAPSDDSEAMVVIDGIPVAQTHPVGWKHLWLDNQWARCAACGTSSAKWSPVRGGDWRCEHCKVLVADGALLLALKEGEIDGVIYVDGEPIFRSHPVGFEGLYATPEAQGYGRAVCSACGETHNRWTPVRAGRWRCDKCRETTNDDAMQIIGKEEYDLENRMKNHRRNGNGQKPAADPVEDEPKRQPAQSVHYSSKSVEWYTPPEIIDLVRQVMPINLDPASCYTAQQVIRADHYFDAKMNGLHPMRRWDGHVFLNPEYGDNIINWVVRLLEEYKKARTVEAILLVPARVDTAWYRLLRAYPRCHINGRLQFWNEQVPFTDKDRPGAPFPSAIFYLGNRFDAFAEAFSTIGDIYTLWRPQS